MNALWSYFWPPLGCGVVIGIIAGDVAYRGRLGRNGVLAIGAALALALAALWHGPLGAADRFATEIERMVRVATVYNEIPEVSGHLHHDPLTRRVLLSGPADDFQRGQLVEIIDEIPGVESVSWSDGRGIPLIVEGLAIALLGFLLGLLVAYLREVRRRYNAQWNW
jgi:hypothetical protein